MARLGHPEDNVEVYMCCLFRAMTKCLHVCCLCFSQVELIMKEWDPSGCGHLTLEAFVSIVATMLKVFIFYIIFYTFLFVESFRLIKCELHVVGTISVTYHVLYFYSDGAP